MLLVIYLDKKHMTATWQTLTLRQPHLITISVMIIRARLASKKVSILCSNFEPWIQHFFWKKKYFSLDTKSQFWNYVNESAFCNVINSMINDFGVIKDEITSLHVIIIQSRNQLADFHFACFSLFSKNGSKLKFVHMTC